VRRAGSLIAGFAFALVVALACGAGRAPVLFLSGPGRFEVAAVDAAAAGTVVRLADEAWRLLAGPLSLPAGFPAPVLVRLVPAAEWTEPTEFRVIVEAGGVVSVRMRWSEPIPEQVVRRALVRGLLQRITVARYGVGARRAAPRWLEEACIGWWETRADGAQLDALKQETSRLAPPALGDLLDWRTDDAEVRLLAVGSVWLLTFLQEESSRAREWPTMLDRLLAGEEPSKALVASFPGRFGTDAARELWWQTGWHHVSRLRTVPTLEAADSRRELADLARFAFADGDRDAVVPLGTALAHGNEPPVAADLKRRATELNQLLLVLHPFYRNAGLALAEALGAPTTTREQREALCGAFEREWRDAIGLESATAAALDALERERPLSSIR
jgi:hypothetical protein